MSPEALIESIVGEQVGAIARKQLVFLIYAERARAYEHAAQMTTERHNREWSLADKEANADDGDLGRACAAKGAAIVCAGLALALESHAQRARKDAERFKE